MKKIAIVALAAAATFITSCDIERMPYDKYTEDKIMEDKDAAVDVLLNGCYAKLKTASEHLHYCGEFPGDNVCKDKPTTNPFGTYFTYQHTVNNGGLSTVWNSAYNIISQTSSLMKMINENESPELNQKLGEAYYMRGMMYFYLCRVFGRPYYQEPEKNLGVPIVNGMPEDMDNLDLPDRSSVKDTYEQVLSDLKKAEELMSDFKSPAYASKYAAQALLAKVYMYMSGTFENPNKEYAQLSYNYANEVIESNQFSLLSRSTFMTYNELAPDAASQTETIFAVKFIASDWDDWGSPLGSMYAEIDGYVDTESEHTRLGYGKPVDAVIQRIEILADIRIPAGIFRDEEQVVALKVDAESFHAELRRDCRREFVSQDEAAEPNERAVVQDTR